MPSFSQWQESRSYPASDAPFEVARTGGPQPFFHSVLDQQRSAWRATPEAQYPDGYLGTLESRRADRLMNNLVQRSQQRPFARGVHKGERLDMSDYFWPVEFNPMTGLMMEAAGTKFTPPGLGAEITGDAKWDQQTVGPRGIPRGRTAAWGGQTDPTIRAGLVKQAPPWSTGRQQIGTAYPGQGRM